MFSSAGAYVVKYALHSLNYVTIIIRLKSAYPKYVFSQIKPTVFYLVFQNMLMKLHSGKF